MKMFGYHLRVKNSEELFANVEGAVTHLAPLGITHLILEINNSFRFQSHPEISSGDVTAQQLKKACDKLRAAGIEPIPLYNCIGHQGWDSRNSLLKAYPEFDEAPHIQEGNFVAKLHVCVGGKWVSTYTPAWCCNEPKVYDVVIPAIEEIVKATGSKTVHLGMDEIFLFGQCERCRGMKPSNLFRDNLTMLRDHFEKMGVSVMIWGDRLLDAKKLLGKGAARRARYTKDYEDVGTSACIDELPKDIIVCDWHYDTKVDFPSARELFAHGYTVWPSCWYQPDAAQAFWEASLDAATEIGCKDRLPGMLITGWGMRTLDELFTLPEEILSETEQNLRKTFLVISERMKEYFAQPPAHP